MKTKVTIREEYKVIPQEKIVICILHCDLNLSETPGWYILDEKWWKKIYPYMDYSGRFTIKAKAKCHNSDEFDEEKGKRIALAKAKIKVYKIATKVFDICNKKVTALAFPYKLCSRACAIAKSEEENRIIELCNL